MKDMVKLNVIFLKFEKARLTLCSTIDVIISLLLSLTTSFLLSQLHVLALLTT